MNAIILERKESGGVEPSPALAEEIGKICVSALNSKLKGDYSIAIGGKFVREEKKKADPAPTPEEPRAEAEATKRRRSKKR
jgi:hypothetical protein